MNRIAIVSEEVVLEVASSWNSGTAFSRPFERFVEFVNAEGRGVIRLNYVGGGGKIMSTFEMGNALKTGVLDILNTNSAYYANLMPEAVAIKLTRFPMSELRKNGTWDYLETLENQRMNAHLLARGKGDVPFHIYLRKGVKIPDGPNLKGLRLRSTPNYQAFFTAMGATLTQIRPTEIYTSMEGGMIDGFGWPIQGVDELGLLPVTAYRIDPGFFTAPNEILINLNTWKKLTSREQAILNYAGEWLETWLEMYEAHENQKGKRIQADAGTKVIELQEEGAKEYLDIAYKAAWEEVLKNNPEHGARLKALIDR